MRTQFLLVALLCWGLSLTAQFKLTPRGITTEDGKGYIVVEVEGKDSLELYNKAIEYIAYSYGKPDEVITAQREGSMIKIRDFHSNAITFRPNGLRLPSLDLYLTTVLEFKDERFKLEFLDLDIIDRNNVFSWNAGVFKFRFFNKDGERKRLETANNFVNHLNSYAQSYADYLSQDDKEEDW